MIVAVISAKAASAQSRLPNSASECLFDEVLTRIQWIVYANEDCQALGADHSVSSTDWELFVWLLRRTANDIKEISPELAIVRMLNTPRCYWLGNTSIDDLVRMRQQGDLEEVRSLFRINRASLKSATVDSFDRVCNEASTNINAMMEEYSNRIRSERTAKEQRQQKAGAGFIFSSALTIGSLAFPAFWPVAAAAALYSIGLGSASVKDLVNDHISGKKETKELSTRPIGVLLRAYEAEMPVFTSATE